MRITLKLITLAVLLIFVFATCKKSSSRNANAGMAGMRTWIQIQVNSNVDSVGARHFDTTYTTVRTQVTPISGTTVLLYHDSASAYADTLISIASHATGIISFSKTRVTTTIVASDTIVNTQYDSVAYNALGLIVCRGMIAHPLSSPI